MKRTIERAGRLLFWCSHFRAYIMPVRCDGARAMAHNEIAKRRPIMTKRGIRSVSTSAEERAEIAATNAERKVCLGCPGVCARSMAELRKGELT